MLLVCPGNKFYQITPNLWIYICVCRSKKIFSQAFTELVDENRIKSNGKWKNNANYIFSTIKSCYRDELLWGLTQFIK